MKKYCWKGPWLPVTVQQDCHGYDMRLRENMVSVRRRLRPKKVLPALAKLTATISTLLSIGPSNYLSACNKSALAGPVFVI